MRLEHRTNAFVTHQPLLVELLARVLAGARKLVLELGAALGSTPLLHEVCADQTRPLCGEERRRLSWTRSQCPVDDASDATGMT